jgi:hypothetical protein
MNNLLNSKFTVDKILNIAVEDEFIDSCTFCGSEHVERVWTGRSWFSISFMDGDLNVKTQGREEREAMINFLLPWLERTKNFKLEDV